MLNLKQLFLVFLSGLAALIHKIAFFKAYKISHISVVAPFDYIRLVFTSILSYFFSRDAMECSLSQVSVISVTSE